MTFENKAYAQVTMCDLSKAFDCVDHDDLLLKLNYYGFSGNSLAFFESYLKNRLQTVSVNGEHSKEILVKYGVPQGSVLGPLLFLISINDLPSSVRTKSLLYADDTTFVDISDDFDQLNLLAQTTLKDAATWFEANGFLLNDQKTQKMLFTLRTVDGAITDDLVSNAKFLGIYIDDKLNWQPHIEHISCKLSRVIYLLKRLTMCVPSHYLKTAYFAYFQSILRYGLILFGNCAKINDILILQKKAIRVMTKSDVRAHCKPLFVQLEIQTIINLYIFDLVSFILKNQDLVTLTRDMHSYNTRNRDKAAIEYNRLSKSLSSHVVLSLKVYNKVINLSKKYTVNVFKQRFYEWLAKNPFYLLSEFFLIKQIEF